MTLISGFYGNKKVFYTIVFVEESPNLILGTVFFEEPIMVPVIANKPVIAGHGFHFGERYCCKLDYILYHRKEPHK